MKPIFLMVFTLVVVFTVCGICAAEPESSIQEQISVTAQEIVGDQLSLMWQPVPGATRYCILIVNEDAEPAYINCFVPEELYCDKTDSECVAVITLTEDMHGVDVYANYTTCPDCTVITDTHENRVVADVSGEEGNYWWQDPAQVLCRVELSGCLKELRERYGVPGGGGGSFGADLGRCLVSFLACKKEALIITR